MSGLVKTPAEIRAEKTLRIEQIDRHLATGLIESREEDEQAKWNLAEMRRTRDELQVQVDALDGIVPRTARVRTIRVVGSKGY